MSDFRRQLGLDWTKKKQASGSLDQVSSVQSEDYMQDALLSYGPRVMETMAKAPNRTAKVFELVDQLGEPVSVLGPVLESLRNRGYVDLVAEDFKGDHTVRLTDRGLKVVS